MSPTEELLDQAIAASQAGNHRNALSLLAQVVALDPRNERAWLWLAELVETDAQRIDCLKRVLSINPDNSLAQQRLRTLTLKAPAPTTPPHETQPSTEPPMLPSSPPKVTGPAATAARQESDKVVETIRLTCPTCRARLQVTQDMDRFACQHCGNEVLVTRRAGTAYLRSAAPHIPLHAAQPPIQHSKSPVPPAITSAKPAIPGAQRAFSPVKPAGISPWRIIASVAILLAICAGVWIGLSGPPSGNDSTPSTVLMAGDRAILRSDDGSPLLVGVDYESLEAAINASVIGDDYAGAQLVATGRLFLVDSGTRVLVTDLELYTTEVRILEGPYQGRKVWVFDEVLRPQ